MTDDTTAVPTDAEMEPLARRLAGAALTWALGFVRGTATIEVEPHIIGQTGVAGRASTPVYGKGFSIRLKMDPPQ